MNLNCEFRSASLQLCRKIHKQYFWKEQSG